MRASTQETSKATLHIAEGSRTVLDGQEIIVLNFGVTDAGFERDGVHLIITTGESRTVIENFFITSGHDISLLQLVDGTQVPGKEFLLAYDPQFDISTAAGPLSPGSSGAGEYHDNGGDIIQGVNTLGTNGQLASFSAATSDSTAQNTLGAMSGLRASGDTMPVGGDSPVAGNYNDTISVFNKDGNLHTYIHGDMVSDNVADFLAEYGPVISGERKPDHIVADESIEGIFGDGVNIFEKPVEPVWGNDKIEVEAKVFGGRIYGGFGNDEISIKANIEHHVWDRAEISGDEDLIAGAIQAGNDVINITGNIEWGIVAGDASNEMFSGAKGGNDTITLNGNITGDDSFRSSRISGDAGKYMENSFGGDDEITVTGSISSHAKITGDAEATMSDGSQGGADKITVGQMQGGFISGDAGWHLEDSSGGNDTITIKGDMEDGQITGDAMSWMSNDSGDRSKASRGGDDEIIVEGSMIGAGISGDAGEHIQSSLGGNDTITIEEDMKGGIISGDAGGWIYQKGQGGADEIEIKGTMSDGEIYGDAGQSLANKGSLGGNDAITIGSMKGGIISGDAHTIRDGAKGGADVIRVTGVMSDGEIYGDAGGTQKNSMVTGEGSKGGDDEIIIGKGMTGGIIAGDAKDFIAWGAQGGGDNITVKGNVTGNSNIYGDAYSLYGDKAAGGHDRITIEGNVELSWGGIISGDARSMTSAVGGNDTITITGNVKDGYTSISGDSWGMKDGSKGGDDHIIIKGIVNEADGNLYIGGDAGGLGALLNSTGGNDLIDIATLGNAYVGGDASFNMKDSTGGKDEIRIGTLNMNSETGDHALAGDAVEKMTDSKGGDDKITIENFERGKVYGDSKEMDGGKAGDDTITVNSFADNAKGVIHGDAGVMDNGAEAGNNTFIYNNTVGHQIKFADDGTVKIYTLEGQEVAAGVKIDGFSNIGGGSGDDILFAGKAGGTLIGGGGKDTFVWEDILDDSKKSIIDDFTFGEDKVDVRDTSGNSITLSISEKGIDLSLDGNNFAGLNVSGGIDLGAHGRFDSFADFYASYSSPTTDSGTQQAMQEALLLAITNG